MTIFENNMAMDGELGLFNDNNLFIPDELDLTFLRREDFEDIHIRQDSHSCVRFEPPVGHLTISGADVRPMTIYVHPFMEKINVRAVVKFPQDARGFYTTFDTETTNIRIPKWMWLIAKMKIDRYYRGGGFQ
jgi:hypothetical protein